MRTSEKSGKFHLTDPMLCPRCQTQTDAEFCPNCSLDLFIYLELAKLRQEVAALRELVQPDAKAKVLAAEPKAPQFPTVPPLSTTPPPLPTQSGSIRAPVRASTELAVGQKWFLGVGVFILLLAAGFFLKYAFDENWIGPAAQVTLGFVTGALLFVGGEVCRRKKLRGLDIALAAVGLGVLYLSIYAANQIYGLIPDPLTILLILLVSAVGIGIATIWDSRLVAVLAFLGGYLAPILDTSERFGHHLFFGCLTIINLASETLAYFKRWNQLYFIGSFFSWILLLIFWGNLQSEAFLDAFAFVQFLFVLYSIVPFLRPLLRGAEERVPLIWVTLLNGWLCVWKSGSLLNYEKFPLSLATFGYAILVLAVAIMLWYRRSPGTTITWLVAQGMIYFLITWSVLFSVHWTTLFWALQCVAGYWVASKIRDRVLLSGTILLGLVIVFRFLILDLRLVLGIFDQSMPGTQFTDGLLTRWIINLPVCLTFLVIARLAAKSASDGLHRAIFHCFEVMGLIALFGFLNAELDRFTWQFFQGAQLSAYSILWVFFAAILLVAGFAWNRKFYRISAILLLFITVAKVLLLDTAEVLAPYRILSCAVLGGALIVLSALYYRLAPRLLTSATPTPPAEAEEK